MTIIAVGYNKKKEIIFGSDRQATIGGDIVLLSQPKIIKKGEIVIGVCGWALLLKVLRYNFVAPKHEKNLTNDEYINTIFVKKLRKCFKDNNVSTVKDNKEDTQSCMLVAYRGQIYEINCDFCVIKFSKDYYAVGSGRRFAIGALDSYLKTKGEIDENAIKIAVGSAIKNDIYCSGKIDIINCKK
jgi:ATP-dependent protease HslVU (ClpYQ) peptidase subunit